MDGAFPTDKGQSFDSGSGGRGGYGGGRGRGDDGGGRGGFRGTAENSKTKLCTRWLQGDCRFGDRCNFAHGEHELRQMDGSEGGRDFAGAGRGRGGGYGGGGRGRGYGGNGMDYNSGYGGGYGGPQAQYGGGYGMEQMAPKPGYRQMAPVQGGMSHMPADAYAQQQMQGYAESPSGWVMYRTQEGEPYYHNPRSNQTTWDRPAEMAALGPHM